MSLMKRKGFFAGSAGMLLLGLAMLYNSMNFQKPGGSRLKTEYHLLDKPLYKLDISWPKFPEHFTGEVFGVAVNHIAGLVYVAQRGDNIPKVLVFSTGGEFIQAWNTTTLEMPHGIFLADPTTNPSVWITDVGKGPYGHTIKQYSPSGKLLKVLGTKGTAGSGTSPLQYDQPAEIFVHSSGEIYIVDGDGGLNNRLLKLSKDLQEVWMHGVNGSGLAQFYIPHSVAVDNHKRVWVADRGNKRIQVFDSVKGDWLGSWGTCFNKDAPYSVRLTPDQKYFVVAQLSANRVALLEAPPVGAIGECKVVSTIQLAEDTKPHLVDLDQKTGALYVAEIGGQQAQKFIPVDQEENHL